MMYVVTCMANKLMSLPRLALADEALARPAELAELAKLAKLAKLARLA